MKNEPTQAAPCNTLQAILLAEAIASLVKYEPTRWRTNFRNVLEVGVSPEWLYEAILQSYLFLGYPAGIEGLRNLSEVVSGRPLYSHEPWKKHNKSWSDRGKNTAQSVYRHHLGTLLSRLDEITPELTEWMIIEGYGKVLSRPRLPLPLREFLIAVVLGAGTFTRQFEAHLHGCKNVSTPYDWMLEWFERESAPMTPEAKGCWDRFRKLNLTDRQINKPEESK